MLIAEKPVIEVQLSETAEALITNSPITFLVSSKSKRGIGLDELLYRNRNAA